MKEVIQGSLGFNKAQIVAILGSNMYKSNIAGTAVKELVQNAFDAIKVAKAERLLTGEGIIKVDIDKYRRVISVSDNGTGMAPQTVLNAFFTIGGSYKGDNVDNRLKSGGYGVAKVAFLFSAESIKVETVRNGQKTVVEATSDDIMNDNFNLDVCNTDGPNGTTVTLTFPEYLISNDGSKTIVEMWSADRFLDNPMLGDVTVILNDNTKRKSLTPEGYISLGTAKVDFGELDLYIKPATCSSTNYHVLSSGLYQFSKYVNSEGRNMGLDVIVNMRLCVDVTSRIYPINNQRENFRDTCSQEVSELEDLIKKIQRAYARGKYASSFQASLSMDIRKLSTEQRVPYDGEILEETVIEVKKSLGVLSPEDFANVLTIMGEIKKAKRGGHLDTSGVNLPETCKVDTSRFDFNKPIFHNNTNMVIEEDARPFLKEIGALLLELRDMYIQTYEGVSRKAGYWGDEVVIADNLSKKYWGISFDKGYFGVNAPENIFPFIGINPFGHPMPTYKGVNPALIVTEVLCHIIIHEINHECAHNEGETFTSALVLTEAEFVGIGTLYMEWQNRLYALVEDNLQLIVKYNKKWQSAKNIGVSLS